MRNLIFVLLFILLVGTLSKIKVDPITLNLIDENGRFIYYHGINVVVKPYPFHPTTDKWDPFNSLVDQDFEDLKKWGFNLIRFYVPWEGLEPGKGLYNETLLNVMYEIVEKAGKHGIDILLDAHQDLLNRKYCGEGAPDWATIDHSSHLTTFPKPIRHSITYDDKGHPALEDCLKKDFFQYYFTYDVQRAFQAFFENYNDSQEHFALMWKKVADKFKGTKNVIGYEIINEPWNGDNFKHPSLLIDGDKINLQPMYERVNSKIRSVDNETLLFFEPTVDDIPITFTDIPGGKDYKNRTVFSYHVYCGIATKNIEELKVCEEMDAKNFKKKTNWAVKTGINPFITEFGAVNDNEYQLQQIDYITGEAEKRFQSWTYWQYKYYGDFTTSGGAAQSLYYGNGTLQSTKVKKLARTYFQAITGKPISTSFNVTTGEFLYEFSYAKAQNGKNSELYISEEYFYNNTPKFESSNCEGVELKKLTDKFYYELIVPDICEGKNIKIRIY